jgi:hypothetical protein
MRPTGPQVGLRSLSAAVSGSFHRHMHLITAAVRELVSLDVRVLSPADPRVVAQQGEFLFVASDRIRSVRLVQDRHLESIRAADFLWLVCPDGYVGQSASMELGFAAAFGVSIFSTHAPSDLTLKQYVSVVPTLAAALLAVAGCPRRGSREGLLIDPHASIEEAHQTLQRVEAALTSPYLSEEPARLIRQEMLELRTTLSLPTYLQ